VNGVDRIYDLVQQPDGKIVVVGEAYAADDQSAGFAIARFNPNGVLDTSFSGDGKLLVNFPGMDYAFGYAVALQSNGKILAGGETGDNESTQWDFAVVRVNPNGTIDTSYGGGDGRVVTNFAGNYDGIWDMVLDADGRLVAAGWSRNTAGTDYRQGYARYTTNGGLDHSFSNDGRQIIDISPDDNDEALGVEVRGDGRIVGVGGVGGPDIGLARMKPGGAADTTFSGDGRLISEPLKGGTYPSDLELAAGNKLVVAGYSALDEFFLARYMPGGALDTSFGGGNGFVVWLVPGSSASRAYHVDLQANSRMVVAGTAEMDTTDFAVARFLP
jgi:uncharacterized delta-60 repeat protein